MNPFATTLVVLIGAFLLGIKLASRERPRKNLITTHLMPARIASTPAHAGYPEAPSMSPMRYCEVRSLKDAPAVACGHSAKAKCSNCGTLLCSAHTKCCKLCGRSFCEFCLLFHQGEHSKPAKAEAHWHTADKRKTA